jgi:plastocyanin
MRQIRKPARALGAALALLALAAPLSAPALAKSSSKPHVVALSANPSGLLKYNTNKVTVPHGKVTIQFTNHSPLQHDVVLVNSKGTVLGKTPVFTGGTKSFTVTLAKGKYTYYCSVPGHRQAGMQGTLTVT